MRFSKMHPVLEKAKTEKECLNFADNAKKKGRTDLVDEANYRAALLRKESFKNGAPRPHIDYHILGLKDGDTIYLPNTKIEATIHSHRTLLFEGSEIYITRLETMLREERGFTSSETRGKWRCKKTDIVLDERYAEIYPKE
jgi:hypothetical protein